MDTGRVLGHRARLEAKGHCGPEGVAFYPVKKLVAIMKYTWIQMLLNILLVKNCSNHDEYNIRPMIN
jgi:hypothetical protein